MVTGESTMKDERDSSRLEFHIFNSSAPGRSRILSSPAGGTRFFNTPADTKDIRSLLRPVHIGSPELNYFHWRKAIPVLKYVERLPVNFGSISCFPRNMKQGT